MQELTLEWPVVVGIVTAMSGMVTALLLRIERLHQAQYEAMRADRDFYRTLAFRSALQTREALTLTEMMPDPRGRAGP